METLHIPVMPEEVIEALNIKSTGVYVDGTLGAGGHSSAILERSGGCTLIGMDRDDTAINAARERLGDHDNLHLVREKFSNMRNALTGLGYEKVDGILLDIGVSTMHLKTGDRGFSFMLDGPLDMRMDRRQETTAADIVNSYKEKDLADLIYKYGEERFSRRIAKTIVFRRRTESFERCGDLAALIEKAVGRRGKIHPATRTFQALRIEVNRELEELETAIGEGADLLREGGRLCVLSYHSLEDRIVKFAFKKLAAEGMFRIITRKPMVPGNEEKRSNPSSRSAKMRVGEKICQKED